MVSSYECTILACFPLQFTGCLYLLQSLAKTPQKYCGQRNRLVAKQFHTGRRIVDVCGRKNIIIFMTFQEICHMMIKVFYIVFVL